MEWPVQQEKLEVMYAFWHLYIYLEDIGRSTWKRDIQTAKETKIKKGWKHCKKHKLKGKFIRIFQGLQINSKQQ